MSLPQLLREFVDVELEDYDRCNVAGELQQLSEELVLENIRIKRGRRLTAEIARSVRSSTDTGKELADRFRVSQATISQIRRGHTWRDA